MISVTIPMIVPPMTPERVHQVLRLKVMNVGVTPEATGSTSIYIPGRGFCVPSSVGVGYAEWDSAVGGVASSESGRWIGAIPDGVWSFIMCSDDFALNFTGSEIRVVGDQFVPAEVTLA